MSILYSIEMTAQRLLIVIPLCLAMFAGNAWCACCALICGKHGDARQVISNAPASVGESTGKTRCATKGACEHCASKEAQPCSDHSSDCKKCAGMMADDATQSAIKPVPLDTGQFNPGLATVVYSSIPPLTDSQPHWPSAAPRELPPSRTLLGLRCAFNL